MTSASRQDPSGRKHVGLQRRFACAVRQYRRPRHRTNIRVAEMAKYCDNTFQHSRRVSRNEVGNLCKKKMGVDSHNVMSVFGEGQKFNLSASCCKPGFGVICLVWSCLPNDLRVLASRLSTSTAQSSTSFSRGNDDHAQRSLGCARYERFLLI